MTELLKEQEVKIIYKNYRGETASRTIRPISIRYGNSEWHKEDQHLLFAHDVDKDAKREFAMKDITAWVE